MLGHASATMTLDTYGHLFEDRLDEVSAAMLPVLHGSTRNRPVPPKGVDNAHHSESAQSVSRLVRASDSEDPLIAFPQIRGPFGEYPRPDSNRRYRLERAAC